MGGCQSAEAQESKKIEAGLRKSSKMDQQRVKLLLLGSGESGKSTIFKQLKILHDDGFSKQDRSTYRRIVHSNTVENAQDLVRGLAKLGLAWPDGMEEHVRTVQGASMSEGLVDGVGTAIGALWECDVAKSAFARKNEFQLSDSAAFFFDELARITQPAYEPSDEDIVRTRVRTVGVVQMGFSINSVHFDIFDVGGQRNERRKWIHCFDDCTGVIFVASLSEYDELMFEDDSTPRISDSLRVFHEICHNEHFAQCAMILMLNKRDLFEDKIRRSPLSKAFPEYDGGTDYEKGVDFIKEQYVKQSSPDRSLYTHVTCATDTGNIRFVFDAVRDAVHAANVLGSGLM